MLEQSLDELVWRTQELSRPRVEADSWKESQETGQQPKGASSICSARIRRKPHLQDARQRSTPSIRCSLCLYQTISGYRQPPECVMCLPLHLTTKDVKETRLGMQVIISIPCL